MKTELSPTLWRTARALANRDRLNLLRLVAVANGTKGVVELAEESNLPVPTASIYLRQLNARGLISVVRSGPFVFYGTGSDRSLPVAMGIQRAFRRLLARKTLPSDWTSKLLPLLTAYSHPRREEIIQTVAACQPVRYQELRRRVGLCEASFLRHLGKLLSARVIIRDSKGDYSLAKPENSLAAVLLSAVR